MGAVIFAILLGCGLLAADKLDKLSKGKISSVLLRMVKEK